MYITKVIDYHPKAEAMAKELEKVINETCAQEDVEFVTFSVTNSAKAIAVFRKKA